MGDFPSFPDSCYGTGRDGEEYHWGMEDMAERSRLLDALNAMRRKNRTLDPSVQQPSPP